jgi:hypothetical protein
MALEHFCASLVVLKLPFPTSRLRRGGLLGMPLARSSARVLLSLNTVQERWPAIFENLHFHHSPLLQVSGFTSWLNSCLSE